MAQTPDSIALHAFVGQVVEQATERLTTARNDAQARQADLAKAKKDAGNHLRFDDIRAAVAAEARLATDAQALAKRMPILQRSMSADLERLLGVSLGWENAS